MMETSRSDEHQRAERRVDDPENGFEGDCEEAETHLYDMLDMYGVSIGISYVWERRVADSVTVAAHGNAYFFG